MATGNTALDADQSHCSPLIRKTVTGVLFAALLVVPLVMLYAVEFRSSGAFAKLILGNAAALLGVPWAGGAASIVVLLFKATSGKIEFKVLGFEFTGASGPIVLWAMCFLAEVLAIHLLWGNGASAGSTS